MSKEHSTGNSPHNTSEKLLIYGRYFARIPKYFNKAIKIIHNYHSTLHLVVPHIEKPLLFLTWACIFHEVNHDYKNFKSNRSLTNRQKTIFVADSLAWHSLASFIFPSIIISNSIHYFVVFSRKFISNKRTLQIVCVLFSVCFIFCMIHPIEKMTTYTMDNTFRMVINYDESNKEYYSIKKNHLL